ncbi:hypothetical protein Asp14428_54710 [Actinoplanes sp. NBRC 14428]|nr:hypothetical protein Asp14428_54710 [Actinoplanes sp. NBRC 14428]
MAAISHADIVNAPKALLHDHLDGGLRPATVVELAEAVGHELPETDPARLGSGSSPRPTPGRWNATWRRSRTRWR